MCKTINRNGNGDGGGEEWDPCLKKQNNQNNKPRQRGLGIAKLEKILRKQKDKEENKMAVAEFSSRLLLRQNQSSSSSFLCPMGAAAQLSMEMMSLPSPTNTLSLTPTSFPVLYGNAGMNSNNGVGGGFSEKASTGCGCFAKICEASLRGEGPHKDPRIESNRINAAAPPPLVRQREQHTYQSPTMNPSSLMSAAWSTSFSAGRNHQIEHPSNQRPYADYSFIRPEEHKIAGTKRPWPFSNEQPSGLYYYPTTFPAEKEKAYESPSCGNDSAIMLEPGKTVSREPYRSNHFGLNSTSSFKHCSSSDANFLTLGLPGSLSPPRQTSIVDFSELNLLPYQGHHQRPTESKPGGSIHQKPSTEGHMGKIETSSSLIYLIDEAEEDSIDFDLKL